MSTPQTPTSPSSLPGQPAGPPPPATPAALPSGVTINDALGHYVTMWKTSVETQEHFNDIEWRIRGLALTVATFAIGAAGVAAKDATKIGPVSLGSMVLLLGLVLWYAFYFVDRFWYHPLLKASVDEGTVLEEAIGRYLPEAHMTAGITARSPQKVGRIVSFLAGRGGTVQEPITQAGQTVTGNVMHSDHKLSWFYRVGTFTFLAGAVALQVSVLIAQPPPPTQPVVVQVQVQGPAPVSSPTVAAPPPPSKTPPSPSPTSTP